MSRTIRTCPRRYIKVPDGKIWHRCKCEWCMSLDKENYLNKKLPKEEIKIGLDIHFGNELLQFKEKKDEYYKNNPYETVEEDLNWIIYKEELQKQPKKVVFGQLQEELLWKLFSAA